MTKLSVLVITKNEEENIGECLESVCWADEIIVVDAYSDDNTCEIARRYTNKVYQRAWSGYSDQKNYGSELATHPWILSIDADERVTEALRQEIATAIQQEDFAAYRIYNREFILGKWIEHGGWAQYHIRLYRKDQARWSGEVHERIVTTGKVGVLQHPILHYSHANISRFIHKLNIYTDLEAEMEFQQGKRKSLLEVVIASLRSFLGRYIWLKGFADGRHGFILATLRALYRFSEGIKLWEMWYKHDKGQTEKYQ